MTTLATQFVNMLIVTNADDQLRPAGLDFFRPHISKTCPLPNITDWLNETPEHAALHQPRELS